MHKRLAIAAAVAVAALYPHQSFATVAVEQIEAYIDPSAPKSHYAAIDFGNIATQTVVGGIYNGITFHALDVTNNTYSDHANTVGSLFYGANSAGSSFVSDVYAAAADTWIPAYVNPQNAPSIGPVPGHFNGGAKIINNSFIDHETSDQETHRRLDFMIHRDDVTFVAAAANTGTLAGGNAIWSSYNAIAVRGDQAGFDPTGSPGKTHADLGEWGAPSFITAKVSGYAAGLYGNAQSASQANALHGVVMRSLLMSGADKIIYTRQTANNLDTQWGAGQADYNNSLTILQGGEQSMNAVVGGNVAGAATSSLHGWKYGSIGSGSQSAVIVHVANAINGLTAALNWDVNQSQPDSTHIDTTNAGVIFPNLALELRPVTFSGGQYVLGASSGDATLHSNASNDNIEYLYSTSALPAGDYAFLISGDSSLTTNVGFSYTIGAPVFDQWNSTNGGSWSASGNWNNGVPGAQTERANFLASPGITHNSSITLDGSRTVGQITFANTSSYSIDPGTGGTLIIDDTLDGIGNSPLIAVNSGAHSITAPVSLVKGVTINTAASTSLSISGNITGVGGLNKMGAGSLTLSGINNFGDTTVNAGTLILSAGGSLASPNMTVAAGAMLNAYGSLSSSPNLTVSGSATFQPNPASGILPRQLGMLVVSSGGTLLAGPAANHANRTVLISSNLVFGGAMGAWYGKLDLSSNDLIAQNGNLANITNQLKQGFNASAGGFWNASAGIISSAAAANASHLTTLGVLQNNDGAGHPIYGSGTALGLFDGQNPTINDVLIKYTYFGDADLSGKVDGTDYSKIDNGFNNHLTGWFNGDFNYDNVIDGSDYSLIDNAFNTQGASLTEGDAAIAESSSVTNGIAPADVLSAGISGPTAAVPEPGSGSVIVLLTARLLLRRRRSI